MYFIVTFSVYLMIRKVQKTLVELEKLSLVGREIICSYILLLDMITITKSKIELLMISSFFFIYLFFNSWFLLSILFMSFDPTAGT